MELLRTALTALATHYIKKPINKKEPSYPVRKLYNLRRFQK